MDLRVENLHYSIEGREIVKGVSLNVDKNRFVTILGPNGCGKSTLLKNIYRIYKPSEGHIYLDEKEMKTYSLKKSAQEMAVVSQFNNLAFDCSVYDVVLMGRTPHLKMMEREHKSDLEIVEKAIEEVGMSEKKNQSYLSLSGGEKQRVVLARAIAQEPSLLILDEPTNHLDIRYQLTILSIVKKLNINVLAVLHDVQMAYKYSDYIYLMKDGKFVYEGKPNEVITEKNIKDIYDVDCRIIKENEKDILINYEDRKDKKHE